MTTLQLHVSATGYRQPFYGTLDSLTSSTASKGAEADRNHWQTVS
jgi:hypothetical protein